VTLIIENLNNFGKYDDWPINLEALLQLLWNLILIFLNEVMK